VRDMYLFLKKCLSFVLAIYIIITGIVFPLYVTKGGYTSIGWDKYFFYRQITLVLVIEIVLLAVFILFFYRKEIKKKQICKLTATEWTIIAFLFFSFISLFFSSYQNVAWHGNIAFYMGVGTNLLILFSFFAISRFWNYNDKIWLCFIIGSGITFILGILNRFSIWPIDLVVVVPEFLSTIGNYNLLAGYFAVVWPIGASLYLFSEKTWVKFFAGIYNFISFCLAIILQADSIFLSLIAVFFILLVLSLGNWEKYGSAYLELIIGLCLANQLMRFLRFVSNERFSLVFDDNIGAFLTTSSFSLYVLALILFPYLLTNITLLPALKERFLFFMNSNFLKKCLIIFAIILVVFIIGVIVFNTVTPGGIFGLCQISIFVFDDAWGNSRGLNWKASIAMFSRMNFGQKLIGIGPDCYAEYLYSFTDLGETLNIQLNNAIVLNAHNEILTMLVNNGIIGLGMYLAIFITFLIRFIRKGKTTPLLYIPVVCVFSYLIHNLVSFSHIMNLTLIFIIMAIGESYYHQYVGKI